jgi:type I restriction enzyme, S subunit
MTHNNKPELKPKLRFPDFQDDDLWESKPLDDICDRIVDKVGDAKLTTVSITAGRGFVSQAEKFGRNIAGEQYKNYIFLQRGDFAYNKGNSNVYPQGCIYRLKEFDQAAASNAFICFRLKQGFAPGFIEGLFEKNTHGRQLVRFLTSGARSDGLLNIKPDEFFSVALPIPPRLVEQQKIADCLSSLDELIAAHSRKVDALKAYKKGLMQALFPREGETLPRLRFPKFQDVEKWEERPLKEVFSIFQGFAFSSNDGVVEGVRWLKIADVSIQQMNHSAASYLPVEYKEKYEKFSVKKGDYVVALTRPILNHQLKMASVDEVFDGALLNQRVGKLVTTQNLSFVYFLLQTSKVINDIEKSISGSEPPNLSVQQIEDLKTFIPTKKIEQQRIADCLGSLDELIAAQTQKLDALRTHKKGLTQQLFPSSDEVEA